MDIFAPAIPIPWQLEPYELHNTNLQMPTYSMLQILHQITAKLGFQHWSLNASQGQAVMHGGYFVVASWGTILTPMLVISFVNLSYMSSMRKTKQDDAQRDGRKSESKKEVSHSGGALSVARQRLCHFNLQIKDRKIICADWRFHWWFHRLGNAFY